MTDAVLKNTLECLKLEKNAPGWLYGLTFRVSVQAYQALSVTLYLLLLHHLSILCIKRTVIVGRNIADLRLIYVPHCREWCYYGKINVPLVVLWGWTGRTHICPHNTTADLAVTGREREMLQPNGRQCCLLKLYQAPVLPLMCDITLWVQPAQPVWEDVQRMEMEHDARMETWQDGR